MLDMAMFFVEEEKADESLIPTLNKHRLLMPFASVDHYRARETRVKQLNLPPLYALPCNFGVFDHTIMWKNVWFVTMFLEDGQRQLWKPFIHPNR
jgi:hypothetical protein